jgi:hypothetical protein
VQFVADGRQRHVHDRDVQAHDEQAHAADRQDQHPAPGAQLIRLDGMAGGHALKYAPWYLPNGN